MSPDNPYQSPASEIETRSASEENAVPDMEHPVPVWGLRLVAAGLVAMSLWAVVRGSFLLLGQLFSVGAAIELIFWSYRLHTLACCLQLVGYLLCIYVPERTRAAKFAVLSAGLQLLLLSPVPLGFVGKYGDWIVDVNVLPIAAFWYFLWVVVSHFNSTAARNQLIRTAAVLGMGCGIVLVLAFVATAGTAVSQYVRVDNFIVAMFLFSASIAYGNFSRQLFKISAGLSK